MSDKITKFVSLIDREVDLIANAAGEDRSVKFLIAALAFYKQMYYRRADSTVLNKLVDVVTELSSDPNSSNELKFDGDDARPSITAVVGGAAEFGATLAKLHDALDPTAKKFYDSLRHKIALYKNLKENRFLFDTVEKYRTTFSQLSNTVLDLDSDYADDASVVTSRENYIAECNKLNVDMLKSLIVKRMMELDFVLMEYKLEFESSEPFDAIRQFNNYCALKRHGSVKGYDISEIVKF